MIVNHLILFYGLFISLMGLACSVTMSQLDSQSSISFFFFMDFIDWFQLQYFYTMLQYFQ